MRTLWLSKFKLLALLATLTTLFASCSKSTTQALTDALSNPKFSGLGSIVQNPSGDYVLVWTPASNSSGSVSYTVYQVALNVTGANYQPGVTAASKLDASENPLSAGKVIAQVQDSNIATVSGSSLDSGTAYAFQVSSTSNGKTIVGDPIYVVKKVLVPILSIVSGNNQTVATGGATSTALKVQLTQNGSPISGEVVAFSITSTGGSQISKKSSITDSNGFAQTLVVSGDTNESVVVTGKWQDLSVTFNIQIGTGGATTTTGGGATSSTRKLMIISGNNQRSSPNIQFANTLTVQALNGTTPAVGQTISFVVGSGPTGTLSATSVVTDGAGLASVTFLPGSSVGTSQVFALWQETTATFNLVIANESLSVVSGNNQIADLNTAFTLPIKVLLTRDGSALANEAVSFVVTSGPVVAISPSVTSTDANGFATAAVTGAASNGTSVIKASWGSLSTTFTLTTTSSTSISVVSGDGQITTPATVFTLPLKVRAIRNNAAVSGEAVSFSVVSGPAGAFGAVSVNTDASGYAQTTYTPSAGQTGSLVIKATWSGLNTTFNLSVNDDQIQIVSGDAQSTSSAGSFTSPLVVRILRNGSPLQNQTVSFAKTSGPAASLSASSVTTNGLGQASITVTAGATSGAPVIQATWSGQSVSFNLTIVNESMSIIAGNNQIAVPSAAFAVALKARILRNGVAVTGETVSFTINSGVNVSFSPTNAVSDGSGDVTTTVTAGATLGATVVRATWGSNTIDFSLTVASNNSLTIVAGDAQTTAPTVAFTSSLQVQAMRNGSLVNGETVTYSIVSGPAGVFSNTTPSTNSSGIAQTTFTPNNGAYGSLVILAVWGAYSTQFHLTVNLDAMTIASGSGQTADPSTSFAQPLQVLVNRNGAALANQSVTFSQVAGGVALTLSATTATTDASGFASINVSALATQGAATVRATWGSQTQDFTLTVSLNTAITIVSGNLQSQAPGTAFANPVKVQVTKNSVAVPNVTVNFTVLSGPTGTLATSSVTTDANGYAQTTVTPAGGTAGTMVVRAVYGTLNADFSLTVIDQTDTTLNYISGNNQTANLNTTLAAPLVVEVRKTSTNVVQPNVTIRFTVTAGNGSINGTVNTIDLVTNSSGQASINFRTATIKTNTIVAKIVDHPSQTYTFTETITIPATTTVDLTQTAVTLTPSTIQADGVTTTIAKVAVSDVYGNLIPATGKTVVFTAGRGTWSGGVVDNGDGTYQRTLIAPTTVGSGTTTVSATYEGAALTSSPATLTFASGAFNTNNSTIAGSSILADGTTTTIVTLTLKDSLNNQLTSGGRTVDINASGGTWASAVVDNANGTYTRTLTSSTLAQTVTLSATVDGVALANNGTLSFTPGTVVATKSTISVSPSTILPNGTSTTTVRVQARDINSNPLSTGGATVTISSTAGTFSSGVSDDGNGSYSRILTSASSPATATISATLNGTALTSTSKVYMTTTGSGPSSVKSTIATTSSAYLPADSSTTMIAKVTLMDSSGVQLTSGGSNVVVSTTAGTLMGSPVDNGDGTYSQTIRAPSSSAIATISATVDGSGIINTLTQNWYGAFSVTTSTVYATPNAIDADGTSELLVTIQAKDSSGISIPVGGVTDLSLSTTAGTLQSTLSDNGNGTYSQYLRAPSSATTVNGTVSATKTVGGALSSTASVQFYPSSNLAGLTIDCANISTYANGPILVDSGTLTMNSYGNAAGSPCPASFVFSNIVLRNGAKLTHSATTSSVEYGLELTAANISIDATSSIDVTTKGFYAVTANRIRTKGNVDAITQTSAVPSYNSASASYGGEGGASGNTNYTYGNPFYPFDSGSAGPVIGALTPGHANATGGGRVKITIQSGGTLTVNGSIKSIGGTGVAYNQSGSGGSIWINTPTLAGTGTISAAGGTSVTGNALTTQYGGGGGRVAVYYTTGTGNFASTSIYSNISACGGAYTTVSVSAPGTVFLKTPSQTYGDMVINNCGLTPVLAKTPMNAPPAFIPQGLNATTITYAGAFADTYGTTSPYAGYWLDPNIAQNANNFSTHTVFKVASASGNSVTIASGNLTTVATNYSTQTTQFLMMFDRLEVKDGAVVTTTAPVVVLNGDLSSGSSTTMNWRGTLPSSIVELPNATSVTLDYSNNTASTLALNQRYNAATNLTLKGAASFTSNSTLNLASLTLDAATLTSAIAKGTTAMNITGALTLKNSASLWQAATTTTTEYSLEIAAGSLDLQSGSQISANARGYVSPSTTCYTIGNQVAATTAYCGGHAGGTATSVFGSIMNPNESGSGGVYGSSSTYTGGGIIRINLGSGAAAINGMIDVRGAVTTNAALGAAAGSIYLNAGALSGNGTINAQSPNNTAANGVGSGGRIAVYYQSTSGGFAYPGQILNRILANSVTSTATYKGASGTIYLKGSTQTYGDLILDNAVASSAYDTYINIPNARNSQSITATTLTDAGQFLENGVLTKHLVGMYLNPNTAQNSTYTLNDDTLCKITDQTANTLTVSGCDLTTIASSGNTYRVVMVLDHLSLNNYAQLNTNGHILVKSGDVTTGNNDAIMSSTSFVKGSGMLEFAGVRNLSLYAPAAVSYTPGKISATGNITLGGMYTFTDPIVSTSGNLTFSNASATIGQLKGTQAINVSGTLALVTSTLTQTATTLSAEYSLEVTAGGLNVDSSSVVSAITKGYLPQASANNLTTGYGNAGITELAGTATSATAGGSHGGLGGCSNTTQCQAATYGSMMNPNESGQAGKAASVLTSFSAGGGILRFNLGTGNAVVNGTIDASANVTAAQINGLGAGGSIYLKAADVSGTGTLKAIGGNGTAQTNVMGGGGGRIALYYQTLSGGFTYPSNIFSRVQAFGGTGYTSTGIGSAGTIFLKSNTQTYGDLIINNNNVTSGGVSSSNATPINMPSSSTSSGLTSTTLTKTSAFKDGTLTTGNLIGFMVNPNTAQNATTTISDDTLYTITSQTDDTLTTAGNMTATGVSGNTYQVVLALDNLDIRGGSAFQPSGSVYVRYGDIGNNDTTSVTLSGSLTTTASPVEWNNVSAVTLNPGTNNTHYQSSLTTPGDLTIQSGTVRIPTLTVGGNLNITGGTLEAGTSNLTSNIVVTGDVTMTGASSIMPITSTSSTEARVYMTAANINVCSTCSINATGRGYVAVTTGRSRCVGNIDVAGHDGSTATFGGSHGGQGGISGAITTAGDTHGSFSQPTDLGCSGAFGSGAQYALAGGGAIRLNATGTLTVNGTIVANGVSTTNGSAGSGGSIFIQAGTLAGTTGTIQARGGHGTTGGTSGGGGRIAIYYGAASGQFAYPGSMITNVTAEGGTCSSVAYSGAAGTLYFYDTSKSQPYYGDLLINNLNVGSTVVAVTTFNLPTSTTSTSIAAQTLTKAAAFSNSQLGVVNYLGFYLNPNTAQNATGKISDDTLFTVSSATANALTVSSGDMTTVATGGNTFRMGLVLSNFEVKNLGKFDFTGGQIRVIEGDISSNNTTGFALDGVLKAYTLDLGTGVTYSGTANASKTITYECNSSSCP